MSSRRSARLFSQLLVSCFDAVDQYDDQARFLATANCFSSYFSLLPHLPRQATAKV